MYSKTLSRIVIWKKPDDTYYFRVIKGHYVDYKVGYINQYNHKIVLIIDSLEYRVSKIPKKERFKKKIIDYISKI